MPSKLALAVGNRIAGQWIALGCQLQGPRERTIIDLEGLICATVVTDHLDPRVMEAALDWSISFGESINAARLRRVAVEIGVDQRALARFAGTVREAGGPRWIAGAVGGIHLTRRLAIAPPLVGPPTLNWRLRAAFGVNARADILGALLASPQATLSITELASRTRFGKANVATALRTMRLAGVVTFDRVGNQDQVHLASDNPLLAWAEPIPMAPVDWVDRWALLNRLVTADESSGSAAIVRTVELRAVLEKARPHLRRAGFAPLDLSQTGVALQRELDGWLSRLADVVATPDR